MVFYEELRGQQYFVLKNNNTTKNIWYFNLKK